MRKRAQTRACIHTRRLAQELGVMTPRTGGTHLQRKVQAGGAKRCNKSSGRACKSRGCGRGGGTARGMVTCLREGREDVCLEVDRADAACTRDLKRVGFQALDVALLDVAA